VPADGSRDLFDDLVRSGLFDRGTGQPPIVKASMGEGIVNLFRWLGEQIRNIPDYWEWFKKWRLSHPTVGPEHRLPDNFRPFDVSRGSPMAEGLRQTLINSGTRPEVADEIIKKIEAEAASDKQIARIGTKLLRITRALNQAAQAGPPTGTPGSAGATLSPLSGRHRRWVNRRRRRMSTG
jgi:hypothetical protein